MHMLRKAEDLRRMTLRAKDGPVGRIEDGYFDRDTWTVRYLSAVPADCPRLFVSPIAVRSIDDAGASIDVNLTLDQVRGCPRDPGQLSRRFEAVFHRHYGWPLYWRGEERWGSCPFPLDFVAPGRNGVIEADNGASVLFRLGQYLGFRLEARDGDAGVVSDSIINDETWEVRFLVIKAGQWLGEREILISPHWIDHISEETRRLFIDELREAIKRSPRYDPSSVITRHLEWQLFKHYRRESDWEAVRVGRSPIAR